MEICGLFVCLTGSQHLMGYLMPNFDSFQNACLYIKRSIAIIILIALFDYNNHLFGLLHGIKYL